MSAPAERPKRVFRFWPASAERAAAVNTVNVCIGHRPFAEGLLGCVDVMLAPRPIDVGPTAKLVVVDDDRFGEHGHSLSEYSQLDWLAEHLDDIAGDAGFIRLIQYRKFLAAGPIGEPSNWEHARWMKPEALPAARREFSRICAREAVSLPLRTWTWNAGMAVQYARSHHLDDLFAFAGFLMREGIMSDERVAAFVGAADLIPSPAIGVYRRDTLKDMLPILSRACAFMRSTDFVPRDGYQRRTGGFLLERLHSHLVTEHMTRIGTGIATGYLVVIDKTGDLAVSV